MDEKIALVDKSPEAFLDNFSMREDNYYTFGSYCHDEGEYMYSNNETT